MLFEHYVLGRDPTVELFQDYEEHARKLLDQITSNMFELPLSMGGLTAHVVFVRLYCIITIKRGEEMITFNACAFEPGGVEKALHYFDKAAGKRGFVHYPVPATEQWVYSMEMEMDDFTVREVRQIHSEMRIIFVATCMRFYKPEYWQVADKPVAEMPTAQEALALIRARQWESLIKKSQQCKLKN